jgi:dephospho-CoA kinase
VIEVGLTGGIASGKSVVSGMLAGLGARVIDADELARQALVPGTDAYLRTVEAFGPGIVNPDGGINRPALGDIVFADEPKRRLLESIVHPAVFELEAALVREIAGKEPGAVVVFDAALLIESGAYARMDRVVVVWCSLESQLKRLMERSGLSMEDAVRRVAAQMPLEEKKSRADFVIDNDGTLEYTRRQVEGLYARLKQYV